MAWTLIPLSVSGLGGLHSSRSQFWERRVFTLIMRYVFTGSEGRKYETVKQRKHLDWRGEKRGDADGGIQEHSNCIIFLIAWLWYIYSHTIQLTHLQYKVQWLSVLYRVMHPWTKSDLWSQLSDNLPCVCILICVMCVDPGACVHVHVTLCVCVMGEGHCVLGHPDLSSEVLVIPV